MLYLSALYREDYPDRLKLQLMRKKKKKSIIALEGHNNKRKPWQGILPQSSNFQAVMIKSRGALNDQNCVAPLPSLRVLAPV